MTSATTVLVVEDNQTLLTNYTHALRKAGFEVDTADNKLEAIEKVRCRTYDVALVDITLKWDDNSDRSGLDVIGVISRLKEGTRVVVVSATDDIKVALRAMDAGVFAFVEKAEMKNPGANIVETAQHASEGVQHALYGHYASLNALLAAPELTPYWETSIQSALQCDFRIFNDTLNQVMGKFLPVLRIRKANMAFKIDNKGQNAYALFWSKRVGHPIWVSLAGKNGVLVEPPTDNIGAVIAQRDKGNLAAKVWRVSGYERDTFMEEIWDKP